MKRKIFIQFLLIIIINLSGGWICRASELSESENELLETIASSHRANKKILNSFECEYTRSLKHTDFEIQFINESLKKRNPHLSIDLPEHMSYKGHFAFKNDKVLSYEDIGDSNDYFHYIKNGKRLRKISNYDPRTFITGTEGNSDITPPIPDPWDFTGHSLMYKLDKIDTPYDKIVSVQPVTENGRELIVVTIEQRVSTSPEGQVDTILTMHFSVKDGYLPVKVRQEDPYEPDEESAYISEAITSEILKYDVDSRTLYLPVSFSKKLYRNGQLSSTSEFNIKEETVKINPELPDDMFWEEIQPGDMVVDKDKGIQYRTPAAGVVGAPAFDFTLELLSGNEKVTLSKIKDEVIVLDFWATWCGPCKKIHPALEAVHKWAKENNKSVAFYCINQKEESDLVAEYWQKSGSIIPVLLDTDGSVYSAYKGSGIPYVIIVSEGIIQNAHIGSGAEVEVLEQHIKDMIITTLED